MPTRILRDWTDSELVNALSANAERHFIRIIQKADDYGRQRAEPRMLRPLLYPLLLDQIREADLERWTAECVKSGLVRIYEVDGKRYLQVTNFGQRTYPNRPSKFPNPPDGPENATPGLSRKFPEVPGSSGRFPPSTSTKSETNTKAKSEALFCSEPQAAHEPKASPAGRNGHEADPGGGDRQHGGSTASGGETEPEAIYPIFPTMGLPKTWELTDKVRLVLQSAFPHVDHEAEYRKAHAWTVCNPSLRKTAGGMSRFLNNWIGKAQNNGAGRVNGSQRSVRPSRQILEDYIK